MSKMKTNTENQSSFNRIVVFGDSLQDNGNVIQTLGIPGKPYDGGRFCDGKVACEYLLPMLESKHSAQIKLENYAIGGAYTFGKNPKSLLTDHSFSVSQQIDRFVASQARFNSDDLVFLNGGGNNFLFALHNEYPYINIGAIHQVADDLLALTDRIIKLGAKKIIVWNIPDITIVPAYEVAGFPQWVITLLKKYLKRHLSKQNKKLQAGVAYLTRKYPFASIEIFDVYHLLQNVLDSPMGYGFENARNACVESFGGVDQKGNIQENLEVNLDPQTHLFWDYVHPTTKAQKMLAEHIFQLLYPLEEKT
ncbi:SGNH/GDSL hydrolase family protein [Facilibium subflavum]|uniref:SGNH/GDSL hydrolase family protein n=1 Tax=Facilibium subflavum TaxID=2219058 RepID=UPI001F1A66E7|nr:SGNH/GDSL hydrolase family protein [Facilibium subflavum]